MKRLAIILILTSIAAVSGPAAARAQSLSFSGPPAEVGAGLQTPDVYVYLSDAQHGGLFVTLASSDSTVAFVARDQVTVGGAAATHFVPNGTNYATFTVQGLENVTGTSTITASAPGFAGSQFDLTVETPQFRVQGLPTDVSTIDPDNAFFIQTGKDFGGYWRADNVRTGGPGLTASITLTNPAAADLVTTAQTGQSVTVSILGGQNVSPATVAAGGVALSGVAAGAADVTVTIPGFNGQGGGVTTVNVAPATIRLTGLPMKLGAGLRSRNGSLALELNGTDHGGTTVHLVSQDSSLVLLAPDNISPGAGALQFYIPDGSAYGVFYAHALEGVTGIGAIEATAPGFVTANDGIDVVQAGLVTTGLVTTLDALDPVDDFYIQVGVPDPTGTSLLEAQPVRPGSPGVSVAVISDNPAVGLLQTTSALDDTVRVTIGPGVFSSPLTMGTGGVAFDGVGAGTVTIHPEADGFVPLLTGYRTVTVTQPILTILNTNSFTVGSGLQVPCYVSMSAYLHGGTTVTIAVDDTTKALISASAATVGGPSADVFVANGNQSAEFFLQAKEGLIDDVTVTVTAPGFADTAQVYSIVQPAIDIRMASYYVSTLGDDQTVITAPDAFEIQVGVPSGPTSPVSAQALRAGSAGIDVTATVDDPAVGAILNSTTSGAAVTARLEAQQAVSPSTVAAGGVAFDGVAAGPVTVTVSSPGFLAQDRTSKALTVEPAAFNTSFIYDTGAGLVGSINYWQLNGTAHGGTTVHLAVSDPAIALLSPDAVTAGQPSIDVAVPDGTNSFQFRVHALEDTTGTVTIDVTAPDLVPSQENADVVTPWVGMQALPAVKGVNDFPSYVVVQVGTPDLSNSYIQQLQPRRPGGPPLVATVASGDAAIAEILDLSGASGSRQFTFAEGADTTPPSVYAGGLGLRGTGPGVTLVSATIPGFSAAGTATQEVTVVQDGVALLGFPAQLGAGLQTEPLVARLTSSAHGGTTVRLATADPAAVLVSSGSAVAGSDTVDIFVPDGQQDAVFHVHALEGVSGTQYVNALIDGLVSGARTLDVVPAAVMVADLADTLIMGHAADEFVVQVGVADPTGPGLAVTQAVRAGVPPLSCPVVLNDGALADLVTSTASADSLDVPIPAGAFQSAATFAAGGVSLAPVAQGAVTVSARPAGLTLTVHASREVYIRDDVTAAGPVPAVTALHGNHPNPFNPMTHIDFSLSRAGQVQLMIHDVRGRLVRTLVAKDLAAGPHSVTWDGTDDRGRQQSAGVYLVRLVAREGTLTHKVALVK